MGTPAKNRQHSRGTSRALRSNDDEDWIDWDDPKRRRQMQNRLNQRAASEWEILNSADRF